MSTLHTPNRRFDTISQNTATILENLKKTQATIENEDVCENCKCIKGECTCTKEASQIPLKEALASGKFSYVEKSIYKEADSDYDYGRIWVKKQFPNEKTGELEDWLVVYTDSEGEIIRQIASQELRKFAAEEGEPKEPKAPKPKDMGIAPGIKSKTINMDQSGEGATAKVTVEFNDAAKGLDFYQNQVGTEGKAEIPIAQQDQSKPQLQPGQVAAPAQPLVGAQPLPAPKSGLKPTVDTISKRGSMQSVTVLKEVYGSGVQHSFVNELGNQIVLPWKEDHKVNSQFERPDTGQTVRLAGYLEVKYEGDDGVVRELVESLVDATSGESSRDWKEDWDAKDQENADSSDEGEVDDSKLIEALLKEANEPSDEEILAELQSLFSEEHLVKMQEMVMKLGILVAVMNLVQSSDYDEIARQIVEDKKGVVPYDIAKRAVEEFFPVLVREGALYEDGTMTQEAREMAAHYQALLDGFLDLTDVSGDTNLEVDSSQHFTKEQFEDALWLYGGKVETASLHICKQCKQKFSMLKTALTKPCPRCGYHQEIETQAPKVDEKGKRIFKTTAPDPKWQAYFDFLDDKKNNTDLNMMSGAYYLSEKFHIGERLAGKVLDAWFNESGERKGVRDFFGNLQKKATYECPECGAPLVMGSFTLEDTGMIGNWHCEECGLEWKESDLEDSLSEIASKRGAEKNASSSDIPDEIDIFIKDGYYTDSSINEVVSSLLSDYPEHFDTIEYAREYVELVYDQLERYGDPKESSLNKQSDDISDRVSPMSWTTDEPKSEAPAGAGPSLPPNQNIQENTPQNKKVLYDSAQDEGQQFQTTINPKEKSVTVKFLDSAEEEALDQALQQPKQPATVTPGQEQQAPLQTNQKGQTSFQDQNIETAF